MPTVDLGELMGVTPEKLKDIKDWMKANLPQDVQRLAQGPSKSDIKNLLDTLDFVPGAGPAGHGLTIADDALDMATPLLGMLWKGNASKFVGAMGKKLGPAIEGKTNQPLQQIFADIYSTVRHPVATAAKHVPGTTNIKTLTRAEMIQEGVKQQSKKPWSRVMGFLTEDPQVEGRGIGIADDLGTIGAYINTLAHERAHAMHLERGLKTVREGKQSTVSWATAKVGDPLSKVFSHPSNDLEYTKRLKEILASRAGTINTKDYNQFVEMIDNTLPNIPLTPQSTKLDKTLFDNLRKEISDNIMLSQSDILDVNRKAKARTKGAISPFAHPNAQALEANLLTDEYKATVNAKVKNPTVQSILDLVTYADPGKQGEIMQKLSEELDTVGFALDKGRILLVYPALKETLTVTSRGEAKLVHEMLKRSKNAR